MEGVLDPQGQLLGPDLPDQRLRGRQDEDQRLVVDGQRLQRLQVQRSLPGGVVYLGGVTPPQVDDMDFLRQRGGGAASAAG